MRPTVALALVVVCVSVCRADDVRDEGVRVWRERYEEWVAGLRKEQQMFLDKAKAAKGKSTAGYRREAEEVGKKLMAVRREPFVLPNGVRVFGAVPESGQVGDVVDKVGRLSNPDVRIISHVPGVGTVIEMSWGNITTLQGGKKEGSARLVVRGEWIEKASGRVRLPFLFRVVGTASVGERVMVAVERVEVREDELPDELRKK